MSKLKRTAQILVYAFCSALLTSAQEARTPVVSTVNVTPERGRILVAPVGDVSDLRMEVVNEAGETVFEAIQGAREHVDWQMKDSAGVRLPPGVYTVTVSYTTQAGKARKRIEQVLVTDERTAGGGGAETAAATSNAPNPQPLVDGTGAANRIPKFTDGDTLASSSMIDVGGNISIGTGAAPAAGLRLQVNGVTRLTPGGSGGYMQFGTPNTETGITWSKGTTSRADIRFNGARLTLAAGTGSGVPANTGLVIDTVGRVSIGTAVPMYKLHVEDESLTAVHGVGHIGVRGVTNAVNGRGIMGTNTAGGVAGYFQGKVQVNGTLTVTGNVCAPNIPCSSDYRLKQNIVPLSYGLNHLMRLRPVSWNWKTEPQGKLQLGLVAQEVEKVLPELVLKDADASRPLGLNYMALLPVAVKAIQEQQQLIERLRARVAQLERAGKQRRPRVRAGR